MLIKWTVQEKSSIKWFSDTRISQFILFFCLRSEATSSSSSKHHELPAVQSLIIEIFENLFLPRHVDKSWSLLMYLYYIPVHLRGVLQRESTMLSFERRSLIEQLVETNQYIISRFVRISKEQIHSNQVPNILIQSKFFFTSLTCRHHSIQTKGF